MHELSLMMSVIDQVQEIQKKENFQYVQSIRFRVGSQSGVSKEALEFCQDEAFKGTVLEGAQVVYEDTEGIEFQIVDLEVGNSRFKGV